MLVTTEGIVLRQRKIANNRRMITVFTRKYGKISCGTSLNEKGRSKTAAALSSFAFSDFDIYKGRDYYNINSAQLKRSFYSIGEDLDRFLVASRFLDYLDSILDEGVPKTRIFDMTLEFLEVITKATRNFETLLYAFVVKTLRFQGVMPELKCCVNCGKNLDGFGYNTTEKRKAYSFSVSSGGVICEECIEREKTDSNSLIYSPDFDIIEVIQYFLNNPLEHFEKVVLKANVSSEIRRILGQYISFYMDSDVLLDDVEWR